MPTRTQTYSRNLYTAGETLHEAWARFADAPEPQDPLSRPVRDRGWTTGLLDVLEPFTSGNPRHPGDVVRFHDLPWTAAARLLALLPAERLADRQNDAPSLGAVLRATVGNPRELEVHGYLVPPSRSDERLTAEGVVVYDHPELDEFHLPPIVDRHEDEVCECGPFWTSVQASFGFDDATSRPQVIKRRECPRSGRPGWYLWWT